MNQYKPLTVSIRNLKQEPEHLAILATWHHEEWTYLNPHQSLQDRQVNMQEYLNDHFIPTTYIAESNHQLLGSAAIIQSDMDNHPELSPWIASVYVTPSARRQGIGHALFTHVMAQAKQQGIKTLYLFTPDQANLYRKWGWETFAQENYRGCDVDLMKYSLGTYTE